MACSVPHTYDEIKCMVEKQIQEDRGRQLAIMNLGHQYGDAIEAKDELLKAYEQCRDISMDKRAMIENFLKIDSELDYEMQNYHEYEDEKNEFDDVVDDNPLPNYQSWQKYMSFKPDIPETPLYKSKPMISKDYKKETDVKVGQNFDNKEALDLAIRLKALDEGYQFLNERSAPERYALKCFHFNECAWKIRATRWGKTEKFSITFFNDVHTCPKTQTYPNHRNANKKVIAHILTPKLQDTKRVLKGKDIQQDIMSEYKINISYQQAWRGKDYCIQQIRGSPYESFEMLPYYCYNLERKNEGTVTRIKTDEKGVFEMLFIALAVGMSALPISALQLFDIEMNRGSILHEDLTYAMLHEIVMKKFNLEAIYPLNLSAKVSSIDDNFDITDDHEVRFFVECASEDE
ncbi:transposase, MuDR, MULE transposase domain protein [Tanacetum coccineum]